MIFLMPLYVNIVMIYSICNIQDVSWGNRATENKNATDSRESLEQYRAIALVLWICINTGYGYGTLYLEKQGMDIYLIVITVSIYS